MNKYHFEIIDSTSTYLKNNYHKHDNLTFVSADFQTHGHGRYNRKWISDNKENLLFSILIKDKDLISKYDCLSLASAACVYQILDNLNIENISIKWPNDVFVNDKKIAGILLESVSNGGGIEALVIGVGLNVNSFNFEANMLNIPTSIFLETNKKISLENLKDFVYECFISMLNSIKNNDKSYLSIVRENNYLKNKLVYLNMDNQRILAEVIGINDNNSLKVNINEKQLDIFSGEVSLH